MDTTKPRRVLPWRSRTAGAGWALFLAAGSGAAAIAGCVRDHPADHWLPGVRCEEGICLREQPDRRSSTFALAPDCWQTAASSAEAGLNAERMTLIGDGDEIVFAAMKATNPDFTQSPPRVAVARFEGDVGCPEMAWPAVPEPVRLPNGAHVVGPGGRFWSFFGDAWGTRGAISYDRTSGWVMPSVVASPTVPGIDANWNAPNALAVTLPGNGLAILRSVASSDTDGTDQIPTTLERWTFGPDGAPTWVAQIQSEGGTPGAKSRRGQVRLFPQDGLGDRLVVLGDAGTAFTLSLAESTATLLSQRPAGAQVDLPNLACASVLLPLRPGSAYAPGSVLYLGGGSDGGDDPERAQRLDLFDPVSGAWTPAGGVLPFGRTYGAALLLPDGSILLAGDKHGSRDVLYIDPRTFTVTIGHDSLSRVRGMGVGGLVLADGRVVLAGGSQPEEDQLRATPDVDLWEPPYLHAGRSTARGAIAPLAGPIPIDGPFTIEAAAGSSEIAEVVLLAYGSSFMGNNPNQRLVELAIDREASDPGSRTIALTGPPAAWAPPGRYLLFALDADRIPSPGVPVDVVDGVAHP